MPLVSKALLLCFQTQNRGGGRLPTNTTSDIKITPTATATIVTSDKDNNEDSNSNSEELLAERNTNNKEHSPERLVLTLRLNFLFY